MLCHSKAQVGLSSSPFSTCYKAANSRHRRQSAVASYDNGRPRYGNGTPTYGNTTSTSTYGNTTSASNRAALTQSLDVAIDTSREAVTTQSVPPPGARKSYRVTLFDAMKFYGPAPEKINGRLAMIGFVIGALNEFQSGVPILEQAQTSPVFTFSIVAIVTYSSLVPIIKGARNESFGVMTPKAEITNARAAMLGFAALLYLENQAGASFF